MAGPVHAGEGVGEGEKTADGIHQALPERSLHASPKKCKVCSF